LQHGLGDRENAKELLEILRSADTDNNGSINYTGKDHPFYLTQLLTEFLAATMNATTFLKQSYLKTAFRMFDTDGNGSIDVKELRTLLAGEEFKDVYTEK
jgi:Ca2+-binding EF-hand superfamily protein